MNLLALLECRPPPEIPPGIGRVYSSDQIRRPLPVTEEVPIENNRLNKKQESRNSILAAIKSGLYLAKDIQRCTGLSKTSIFTHCNVLAAAGLITISNALNTNIYRPATPKSNRKVAK